MAKLTVYTTREHFEDAHQLVLELRRAGRRAEVHDALAMKDPPRSVNRWVVMAGPRPRLGYPS